MILAPIVRRKAANWGRWKALIPHRWLRRGLRFWCQLDWRPTAAADWNRAWRATRIRRPIPQVCRRV